MAIDDPIDPIDYFHVTAVYPGGNILTYSPSSGAREATAATAVDDGSSGPAGEERGRGARERSAGEERGEHPGALSVCAVYLVYNVTRSREIAGGSREITGRV